MMDNEIIIKIEGLRKHFPMGAGKFTALNGIDLTFGKGEFAGIIGPSGSGKTTLLNIIGTLDAPSEGSAIILGQSVGSLSPLASATLRKSKLGFIFQTYNLFPVLHRF
jgi:putative ABC transport system ATP-binding protein